MSSDGNENVKINYLIGSWSGTSRGLVQVMGNYLQEHLEQLDKISHSLAQISIGYPYNPDEPRKNKLFMANLPKTTKHGVPIVVHNVPNISRSYSQWSYMFGAYRDRFTHYIFIEDDYVPVKDHFDKILVDLYEARTKRNCGYLCGMVWDESGRFGMKAIKHAAISNGISSYPVLKTIWDKNGCLPHDKIVYRDGQIIFSQGFTNAGYDIQDYIDHYRCLYWQHGNSIRWYWDGTHNEDLIVPIQYLKGEWPLQEFRPDVGMVKPPPPPPPPPPKQTNRQTPPPVQSVPDRYKRSFQLGIRSGRLRRGR